LQAAIEAFNRRDSEGFEAFLATDAEIVPVRSALEGGRTSNRKKNAGVVSISADLVRRVSRTTNHDKETQMRFMVLVPGSPESEAGEMPSTELLGAMTKYNEELVKSGVMLAGEGLLPTSKGAKVRFNGSERTVIDGPFTEAKELVAGYWVWQCASREEAIEWLKRAPFDGGVEIEVRQIFEADDFGEQLTPELREANQRLREQTAEN
jgi:hypothetical protein